MMYIFYIFFLQAAGFDSSCNLSHKMPKPQKVPDILDANSM